MSYAINNATYTLHNDYCLTHAHLRATCKRTTNTGWFSQFNIPLILVLKCLFRLCHELLMSTLFTHQEPNAWGYVNHVESEPSDMSDLWYWSHTDQRIQTAGILLTHTQKLANSHEADNKPDDLWLIYYLPADNFVIYWPSMKREINETIELLRASIITNS